MNQIKLFATSVFLLAMTSSLWGQEGATKRRFLNLPSPANAAGLPFSDGVLVGNTLYFSGRLGIDPKTGMPAADLNDEIRYLFEGLKAVLTEANMTVNDLVQVQVFCPDLSLYDKFNVAYRTYFEKEFPARAFIGSGQLLRGARFEILGVAVK